MDTVFDPFRAAAAMADVAAFAGASAAAIRSRQQSRIAHALAAARAGSALYRKRLSRLPDHSDALEKLEPVSRGELMARFDEWVTDPALKLPDLRALTADPSRVGEAYLGRYLIWESSGTSGEPGIFVQDGAAMAVYDALEGLRRVPSTDARHWFDPLRLSERIAFVGATDGHFASYLCFERLRSLQPWLSPSLRSFSILQPVDALIDELHAFAPTVVATYPTVASMLAEEAAAGRLELSLSEVWTGGETLTAEARRRIEETLGGRVRNNYGSSEFLAMGWECAHGRLHLNSDWLVLEPVDEKCQPVPAGEPSCSVLLTNLANEVQPLIRYDLGDEITLHGEPCACGSAFPVFEIQGRRDDSLHVPGRHGHPVVLLPLAISTVLEEEAGVFEFQIRQQADDSLVLRLPQSGAGGRAAMTRARAVLKRYVEHQGAAPLHIKGELGQSVPRGRSGKACRIQVHQTR